MARPNQDAIDTFVGITGASEAIASRKLEEHGGDLNAAVNAYFGEGDTMNTRSTSVPVPQDDFMNIDDSIQVEPQGPLSLLSAVRSLNPFSLLDSSFAQSFFEARGAADFTNRSPWVSQPREVREIPIEVKDDTNRSDQSGTRPRIEEVTGSTVGDDREVRGTVIVDDGDVPTSNVHTTPTAPQSSHFSDYGDDIEEEILKAAIEASKREAEGHSNYPFDTSLESSVVHGSSRPEDIELACAVSLSLKTAEQEKALREQVGVAGFAEQGTSNSSSSKDLQRLPTTNGCSSTRRTSSGFKMERGKLSVQEEVEDAVELPLLRQRSRCNTGAAETDKDRQFHQSQPLSSSSHDVTSLEQPNGPAFHSEEWGGISSEEHDEAVMLEAALFGGVHEGNASQFSQPHQLVQTVSNGNQGPYVPRPPSPTLTAQRLLREQQDAEYLAALIVDQEREIKAKKDAELRCLEEAAAREAALREQKLQEEEVCRKMHEEEETERLLAEKQASLPQEPALNDESAVTLLVQMPDGCRRCRCFLKSDRL